jgi:UDP-N-acetylglucosamine 2-epimerase (non-hydrolysing)
VFADNGLDTALLAAERGFGLVTLHRPSNVDHHDSLAEALAILREVSRKLPLIWPLHPRTRANIDRFGLWQAVDARSMFVLPPQGYLETLGLIKEATLVITDSGGIQEDTTSLGVPCLTMRENTERPIRSNRGPTCLSAEIGRSSCAR